MAILTASGKVRERAKGLGLTMRKRSETVTLFDGRGRSVFAGNLAAAETWVGKRFTPQVPGPGPYGVPPRWRESIDLLANELRPAKRGLQTIKARVERLLHFARANPGIDPLTVTRNVLVRYLGENDSWTKEYAHIVRTSLRVFFGLLEDLELRPTDPSRRLPRIYSTAYSTSTSSA